MFHTGQKIGVYSLIRELGKGGFGEVWLAENLNDSPSEKVAIKLPRKEQIDFSAIKDEIFNWTLSGKHKNILPIIECETFGNQIAIVSEFAPGGSLQDLLNKQGSLPIAEAVEITIGILDGLTHLHKRKIIHRDLKPDNVLFQEKIPRLSDFGISRAMQIDSQSKTVTGTYWYMAPEAYDGKRNAQTDIWSVGVMLYQLLTGNLPFPQQERIELLGAIIMKEPPALPDSMPPVLLNIVNKSLAKQTSERYNTADEMLKDLKSFANLQGELLSTAAAQTEAQSRNIVDTSNKLISTASVKTEIKKNVYVLPPEIHRKQEVNRNFPFKSVLPYASIYDDSPITFLGFFNFWTGIISSLSLVIFSYVLVFRYHFGKWNTWTFWSEDTFGFVFIILAIPFISGGLIGLLKKLKGINSYWLTIFNLLFLITGILYSIFFGTDFFGDSFLFLLIPPLIGCIMGCIIGSLLGQIIIIKTNNS